MVLVTWAVVMVKVPVVAPAAIVTLLGTYAGSPAVHRSTEKPPAGAAAVSVTVPVALVPPATEVGLTVTADKETIVEVGVILSVAVWLTAA
jgi:hypothetical protein